MAQEIEENPEFPKQPAFYAKVEFGTYDIIINGMSLSSEMNWKENYELATDVSGVLLSRVVRSRFSRRKLRGRRGNEANVRGVPYVFVANNIPHSVTKERILVNNINIEDGSIKIRTALSLVVSLQVINVAYDSISKYPSFKQGISEIWSDIGRTRTFLENLNRHRTESKKRVIPPDIPFDVTAHIDINRVRDEDLELALEKLAMDAISNKK